MKRLAVRIFAIYKRLRLRIGFLTILFTLNFAHAGFLRDSLKKCGLLLGLVADPFSSPAGWFTPQFKSKGDAEQWLLQRLPKNLDAEEHDLLMEWPRQGHSLQTNKILRADRLAVQGDEVIIPSATLANKGKDFTPNRMLDTFAGIFSKSRSDRAVTVYRAIGKSQFGAVPEVGAVVADLGIMNVSLDQKTVAIHGSHRARREEGQIRLVLNVPKGYPLVPTLAHHSYTDSSGNQNVVSVELEMILPPGTTYTVVNKTVGPDGTLTIEGTVKPRD